MKLASENGYGTLYSILRRERDILPPGIVRVRRHAPYAVPARNGNEVCHRVRRAYLYRAGDLRGGYRIAASWECGGGYGNSVSVSLYSQPPDHLGYRRCRQCFAEPRLPVGVRHVYAAEVEGGLIKFGSSRDVHARMVGIDGRLIAATPGELSDELAIHHELADHVARGREWFHPTPEVMGVVARIVKAAEAAS